MNNHKSLVPKTWNVSLTIRQRVGESSGRQRVIKEDDEILVILHQVPSSCQKTHREAALFWFDGQGSWKSSPSSGGRSELKTLVDNYQKRIGELDVSLDAVDDVDVIHSVIEEATPLVRAGRHLAQVVSELRKMLPNDFEILAVRDQAVDMERSGELLLQDAKSGLEFMIAKNSVAQAKDAQKSANEVQKLNRLAAFFLPLMAIASVFGMNEPYEILSNGRVLVIILLGLILGLMVRASLKKSS